MSKSTLEIRSAPHVKGVRSVEQIMRHVVYSLLPICAFFVYQYGISALTLIVVVTGTCVWTERLFANTGTQSGNIADYSSVITGLLLALTLPPGFPLWMAVVAAFISIALGKALFGGIGFNVFNPALVGRAFAQAAFPTAIATYTPSFLAGRGSEFIPSSTALPLMQPADTAVWLSAMKLDAWTGATPLSQWKFEHTLVNVGDLLTSLGSQLPVGPSPVLIALCGLYLALRRFMDWRVPTAVFGGAALTAWILFLLDPTKFPTPGFSLLSGGLALGAVYMATDMATSPVTPKGMWFYGGLIGMLTVVIRSFSGLPEGVRCAILRGSAVTPLIERITQRTPFGKSASKKARRAASYPLHPGYISRDGDVQERDKS